jgi:acetylornithine aminotransferase
VASNRPDVVAVLLEPIQGEAGVVVPPAGYLAAVRALCDANGWLMIADEVQTGLCRTGRWFGCQHEDVVPDVVTLAKSLGNGVPIGACLARGVAAELIRPGNHASTFGGNPLACRAALAVLSVLEAEGLDRRAAFLGAAISAELRGALVREGSAVGEVRGQGLMIGIAFDRPCGELARHALDQGLLINVTAERVVRLLPPLVLTDGEAAELTRRLIALFREGLPGPGCDG